MAYANAREKIRHTLGRGAAKSYSAWTEMRRRCRRPDPSRRTECYAGISICKRWADFENFLIDMGPAPEGMSIDRIDSTGDYTPDNCRWADARTQSRNRPGFVKLSKHDAVDVRWLYSQGLTQQRIADLYGVTQPMIGYVVRGEFWA